MKKNQKKIIIFFIVALSLLFISMIIPINGDEIWNFGFSYNTATGLLPYKDFNMVTLPFYQLFISIILIIFGKKIIIMNLFCSFLVSAVLVNINKRNYKNIIYLVMIMIIFSLSGGAFYGYNTFASVILILIIYLEHNEYKYKNEIIGFLISMVLMTKINLGLFMFIPYFIFSKHKIKSILYTSIIPIIILVYLIATNSLLECIDYCFLGLNNFKNNITIHGIIIIVGGLIVIFLAYKYWKTKDKIFIYLLLYQFSLYPIFDLNHLAIAILPFIYYMMYIDDKKIAIIFYKVSIVLLLILLIVSSFSTSFTISFKNNYLFGKNLYVDFDFIDSISGYYIENKEKDIFILSTNEEFGYFFKMLLGIKITKYDFLFQGNMGSDEDKVIKEIDEICKSKQCLFLTYIDEKSVSTFQLNRKHLSYVFDNYKKCDGISFFDIYCNEDN